MQLNNTEQNAYDEETSTRLCIYSPRHKKHLVGILVESVLSLNRYIQVQTKALNFKYIYKQ